MASQIAHIVYAKKYFEALETGVLIKNSGGKEKISYPLGKLNKDEFILGCVFPDIRLIDESISRKDTHFRFGKLDLDFSGLSSFEAGWKFHLYCDMKREDILKRHNFYFIDKTADYYGRPAKLFEDALVYDSYNNWEKLTNYFNNPPLFNSDLNVSKNSYDLWYAILAKYVKEKPNLKSIKIFLSKVSVLHKKEIADIIEEFMHNVKVAIILEKVYNEIV